MVLILAAGAVIVAPFAHVRVARVDVFIPVIQALLAAAELITAILLFAQFSVQRERALLMLAAGYICSGLFAFLQTLTFPGGYAPEGLIGDGLNSAAWFFVLWHIAFPLSALAYGSSKSVDKEPSPRRSASAAIALTVVCVLAIIAAGAALVTAGSGYLPNLFKDLTEMEPVTNYLVGAIWLLTMMAVGVLFVRRHSILDLWLMVALAATLPDLMLSTVLSSVRFTVGWYVARTYALIASGTVLGILLVETTVLYAHLAGVLSLLQRERADRLMTLDAATAAMAHELRQPLAAIGSNASAALNWLKRNPPEIGEAQAAAREIVHAVRRAADVISSVRELFRRQADHRSLIYINNTVRHALGLMRADLRANQVSVEASFGDGIPPVHADRQQLQQVILNLVKNALDAMASLPPETRRLRVVTMVGPRDRVLLIVEDSGDGISSEQRDRIFDPFFTTKPSGMGLGLSICRSIVADHGGTLRLLKTGAEGSSFELEMPAAANRQDNPAAQG